MLKKEIHEVLKQGLYLTAVSLLTPAVLMYFMDLSYIEIFFPSFQFGMFFWALMMGNFIFFLDRGQQGMEYLLSLPYSRYKLLGYKILPRLFALLAFYGIHALLYTQGGGDYAAIPIFFFTILYFAIWFIGIAFSTFSDNFVASSLATGLFLALYLGLLLLVFRVAAMLKNSPLNIELADLFDFRKTFIPVTIFLVLPFLVAFLLSFKKYDLRPAKVHNLRFFKFYSPLLVLGFLIALMILSIGK
jgi:hypothetical protein